MRAALALPRFRWLCALIGHDLRPEDTEILRGHGLRTKCRRCEYALLSPEPWNEDTP